MPRAFWAALLLLCCLTPIQAENWANLIGEHLGFLYDSHGCLHFTPSDIYLLVKTVPKGARLTIKGYGETSLPAGYEQAPLFRTKVNSPADVAMYAGRFADEKARLVVYPKLGWLFIVINERPIVKAQTLAGPERPYQQVFSVEPGGEIKWDGALSTPTDPGEYTILGVTDHYLSNAYRDITIVPFGGWLVKQKGTWAFQNDDRKWDQAPGFIAADLNQPSGQQDENFFDVNLDQAGRITAARWGGNDFGKYALLWTKDGRNRYPELGYAEGQLLYEQIMLVKDLADLLAVPGPDSLDACLARNENFKLYRAVYEFLATSGEVAAGKLDPVACSYVKLWNGFRLTAADRTNIADRVEKGFRARQLGLYNFVRDYDNAFDKDAGWYTMVRDHWDAFRDLRIKLRHDFDRARIYQPADRVRVVEQALNERLEFRPAVLTPISPGL